LVGGDAHRVSIIMPTYNHEKFISACIQSVLSQTYSNWEQIIVDDGSTDRTRDIIRSYSDSRIRLVEQPHQGIEALAHTYNLALNIAKGSLIAILEGDDLWPPEKLSKMVRVFDDQEVVLAHGEVMDVDAGGELSRRNPRVYRKRAKLPRSILFNDPVGSATAYLLAQTGQSFIAPATVLLQSSALKSIGGFQYVPGQCSPDIPTFVRLSVIGKFHYTPAVLGFHRRYLGQATLQNLSTMPQAARRYALDASKDPGLGLDMEERARIEISWKRVVQKCAFSQGRIALINREWKSARLHFTSAIRCFESRIMFGAGLGWMLSWFHCDLEAIFRLAGRTPLKHEEA
jgi:glycosyltransferase involved in cell wall biosynthesis